MDDYEEDEFGTDVPDPEAEAKKKRQQERNRKFRVLSAFGIASYVPPVTPPPSGENSGSPMGMLLLITYP